MESTPGVYMDPPGSKKHLGIEFRLISPAVMDLIGIYYTYNGDLWYPLLGRGLAQHRVQGLEKL